MQSGNYVKCNKCNLVAVDPLPQLEDMIERSEYWAGVHHIQNVKVQQHYSKKFQQVIYGRYFEVMQSYKFSGRILDIGCGIGSFIYAAGKMGWNAYGVDIGPSISVAMDHNLSVFKGRLEDASFPDNYFDVISMFDVIEHINDLNGLMATIRKKLRSKGLLIIKTPNLGCLTARLLRQNWSALQPLDHLVLFSSATIKTYLTHLGYDVLRCETLDINIYEIINAIRKIRSVDNGIDSNYSKRGLINSIINNKSLQITRNIMNKILNIFNLGESIIVWAENC